MKRISLVIIVLVIAVMLSVVVLSQINRVTPTISLEEKKTCTTKFYDEVELLYGNCIAYHNYTTCLNTSGPNTACAAKTDQYAYECKLESRLVKKNNTDCSLDGFEISVEKGKAVFKKQLDFLEWGACKYEEKNSCLIITCVSHNDGAFKGQFTDCSAGKSCQRFEICDNSIKTYVKHATGNFVSEDPSFFLDRLALTEVAE